MPHVSLSNGSVNQPARLGAPIAALSRMTILPGDYRMSGPLFRAEWLIFRILRNFLPRQELEEAMSEHHRNDQHF